MRDISASPRTARPVPSLWLALVALVAVIALAPLARAGAAEPTPVPASVTQPLGDDEVAAVVPYRELLAAADARRLNAAVVDTGSYWVAAVDRDGRLIAARIPPPRLGRDYAAPSGTAPARTTASGLPGVFALSEHLRADGVAVLSPERPAASGSGSNTLMRYLILPLGIALLVALAIGAIVFFRRRNPVGRGSGGMGAHGRIRKSARVEAPATRFADVAGCDEAVEELQEVVTFLQDPERFARVGAKMPRGVVLHGPPGTGKTLLAKAVAGEAGVPFFATSGSDFVDTFVGVGSARVRDLFAQARESEAGAIIFFDEIDAIGRARGSGVGGADSEREGTLNQLLVELDGFAERERLVVVAATNRLDMLDKALLRPGRFDRRVQVGLPAERGRLAILRLHSAGMPIGDPAALEDLARVTAGFAGADLANVVNEAAIMAARAGRETILAADLDEGMLRAIAGPQRADRRLADGELEVIAWHEAGHALAAELCPSHQKTQRVTILSRGDTGGLALYGNLDRALASQQQIHERMVVGMAGRAAEQIGFGAISSGAANDLELVNGIAREAVERLGFSPRVGQIITVSGPHQVPLSGETRRAIDEEIGRMVDAAYADAVALLTDHRAELEGLATALLEHEQLDRADIERILTTIAGGGRRLPASAGALPTERVPVTVAVPAPPVEAPPAPAPAPGAEALPAPPAERPPPPAEEEPAAPRRRLARLPRARVPLGGGGSARRRRVRRGIEGAAASIYTLTLPHLHRRRRKRPGLV